MRCIFLNSKSTQIHPEVLPFPNLLIAFVSPGVLQRRHHGDPAPCCPGWSLRSDLACPDAEHAVVASRASCEVATAICALKQDSSGAAGLLFTDRRPLLPPCPPRHLMVQNSIVQYCKLLSAPFWPVSSSIAGPFPAFPLNPSLTVGVLVPSAFIPFFYRLLSFLLLLACSVFC